MTLISLNVIAYNEEARLEECLTDARDFVDEIVVVDQMSTDATSEIAQRLSDVYVRDVHHGHAEPSRELAASRSSGEWILILDADERMSDLLKAELRTLVEGVADGYWIRKSNLVDGVEVSTIEHYRLVRKSRVRFDPGAHGGATALSDNVAHFDQIGIVHEKTTPEQVYDDARYEQMSREGDAPSSIKRNWLGHNRTLREQRALGRRSDLAGLVPADAGRVLVVGDVLIDLPGRTVLQVDPTEMAETTEMAEIVDMTGSGRELLDAVVVGPACDDVLATVRAVAGLVRPGGVIVGAAPAARNLRRLEHLVGGVLSDGGGHETPSAAGTTRGALREALPAVGLDICWLGLVADGWLDPVALRPDGTGALVESEDFLLRSVPADAAEELSASEIVFAASRRDGSEGPAPECSVVVAALDGTDARRFSDALAETAGQPGYEMVVVQSGGPAVSAIAGAITVVVDPAAGSAARWNAGARAARGELLVFATADAIPLPGWLDHLVGAHRSRPAAGAIGSKVVAGDGTVEHAGLVLGPDRIPYRIYQGEAASAAAVNRPRIMPAVAADGMLVTRARFVQVGGFDEALGDDLADADLCLRLRARGLAVVYAPAAGLRATVRSLPGTRGAFRRSARAFVGRWTRVPFRSDQVVCEADGTDAGREFNCSWRLPRPSGTRGSGQLPAVAWSSHFLEKGGYTEEAIAAVVALDDAGVHVVANPVSWERAATLRPADEAARLEALMERDLPDDFVHVAHIGANRFKRHPAAMRSVGRTMFETDDLPAEWRDRCNAMDEVWVPSEHNLRTFAKAGVASSKLHLVPETFDAALFDPAVDPLDIEGLDGFVFLSVFDWNPRKAWDVLLAAWFQEFGKHDEVTLLVKTDTSLNPGVKPSDEIDGFLRGELKLGAKRRSRVVVVDKHLEVTDIPRLYRAADAFVLASHGEGWGRPYMEAMAMGLPTIATRWSGNLDFMNDGNSCLVDYELVDAPRDPWTRAQRWADPSLKDLRRVLRWVYEHRDEAAALGSRARSDVLVSCRPELVVEAVRERIEAADGHPVHVAWPPAVAVDHSAAPSTRRRRDKTRRTISACVLVEGNQASLPECVHSLGGAADEVVVVHAVDHDGDRASALNEALDRATGSWVLAVQATHTLDPTSVDLVRDLVDEDRFVGHVAIERHQFGMDGAVSSIEAQSVALFPRHEDLRWVGPVDEQLLARRSSSTFRQVRSQLVLHQHDARPERYDPVAAARRNLPALQRSAREQPSEPVHLFNLGRALERLGLHGEAEATLRAAVDLAPTRAPWVPSAYVSLSHAVGGQGRRDEQVKLCKRATTLAPGWADGWCRLGDALVDAGRLRPALAAYERALDGTGGREPNAADRTDTIWQARAGMGKVHLALEEFDRAAQCLEGALARNPTDADLRIWLARAYDAVGRLADAKRHLEVAAMVARVGPAPSLAFADFFTKRAEAALLRGLADNAESRMLLERIERIRAAGVMN